MIPLRKNPHFYQINLMQWLSELSTRERKRIDISRIPRREWASLRERGFDAVWLMGMWQRSPDSALKARGEPSLVEECRRILSDFHPDDIVGSPYAVFDYRPDPQYGSEDDLLNLKIALEEEGLLLLLDFVPNHTACDHPWTREHPDWYVQATQTDSGSCREGFYRPAGTSGRACIAHGKDPHFPPWTDTAQIDCFHPEALKGLLETVSRISRYCHGFRCDMAMLVVRRIFEETWAEHLKGERIEEEIWPLVIDRMGSAGRDCLWIAEVYWGMERELLHLGFDYTYDKGFYDLLVRQDIPGIKAYLCSPRIDHSRMVRFLENHDERRALETFGLERIRSAMVIHATVPGLRFWQHGQLQGMRNRVPVQLRRAPRERGFQDLEEFSDTLLGETDHPVFHNGHWVLCQTTGWEDNNSYQNLLVWSWRSGGNRRLIVVNFSSASAQGLVKISGEWLPEGETFTCYDPLKEDLFVRSSYEAQSTGLYVALSAWDFHFFRIE